ncbi:alpha-2-macroglobulin family protein [Algicola sagamiensis]|uniref:alpha-2-macroglobulin family protein n=1 Tax=Algicola sagamiensis TaxID=163869 RepID=UPI000363BDF4|nr:alpha-2-macroglobulin [Algicola sagamiensis]
MYQINLSRWFAVLLFWISSQAFANAEVNALQVLDISERHRTGQNMLSVRFSQPLDTNTQWEQYLSIKDGNNTSVDGAWIIGERKKTIWFPYVEPSQPYVVTVLEGLQAANGSRLDKSFDKRITTRALPPSVSFSSDGSLFVPNVSKGLPITTVNIDKVQIDFFRIPSEKVNQFFREYSDRNYSYWFPRLAEKFGELVYSGRYSLEAQKNKQTQQSIDLQDISELQKPAVYYALMYRPGKYDEKYMKRTWFTVSDFGVHARVYHNRLDVHLSSVESGEAQKGIEVTLREQNGEVFKTQSSNQEGVATFQLTDQEKGKIAYIYAHRDEQLSVLQYRLPALDLSAFDLGTRPQRPTEIFLYSPRDLYRPGEVVTISALMRDHDGVFQQASTLSATVVRPDGTELMTTKIQPQASGYFQDSFTIPRAEKTGDWRYVIQGPSGFQHEYPFKIEEFLPERMSLTLSDESKKLSYGLDETIRIKVQGDYLYGAPAAGNKLTTQVSVRPNYEPIPTWKDFIFGDKTNTSLRQLISHGKQNLDDKGAATIELPSQWHGQSKTALSIHAIVSLFETGSRPVTRMSKYLAVPNHPMIGVRPTFTDNEQIYENDATFEVLLSDLDGQLQHHDNVKVTLIQKDRNYFWVFNNEEGWHYEFDESDIVESVQTISLSADEPTKVKVPVSYGSYWIKLETDQATTVYPFYAGYNWYEEWVAARKPGGARPDRVVMALNKGSYNAGDVATVHIKPPYAGEALIMVESAEKPLWMKRFNLSKEGKDLEIPVGADWSRHDLFVSAVVLKPMASEEKALAKRSFGLIHLPLNRENRKLTVALDAPDKMSPNKTLTVNINVNGEEKPGEKVHVTLAAVDVGALNITNFKTPDPVEYFFGKRRYTPMSKDIYNKVIEASLANKAKLRFGGDADLGAQQVLPETDVQIVSLFSGLTTVENKQASVSFELPDFNGRVRLMAVAFSKSRYGAAEKDVTISAPIITQLAMPRFIAKNDQTTIALDVVNNTEAAQNLTVVMRGLDAVEMTNATVQESDGLPAVIHEVVLSPKEKTTLREKLLGKAMTGKGTIEVQVAGDGIEDFGRVWTIGARPAYPITTKQKTAALETGASLSWLEADRQSFYPETLNVQITASSRVPLNLEDHLDGLLRYPYGCLEQTTSGAFPLLFATQSIQQRMHLNSMPEDVRVKGIQAGINRVSTMQKSNGSFGLWSSESPEEHWLTAYVMDFLLTARDKGAIVPEGMIEKGVKRLKAYVHEPGGMIGERYSEDKPHYRFAYKAYAGYILARMNQASLSSLRVLYMHKMKDAKSSLAKLHLGLALLLAGDTKQGAAAIEAGLTQVKRQPGYLGDYGSNIRDYGHMIYLLEKHQVQKEQVLALAKELATALEGEQWFSTQERQAMFLAGIAMDKLSGKAMTLGVQLGNEPQKSITQTDYRRTWFSGDFTDAIVLKNQGTEGLYGKITWQGYTKKRPTPVRHAFQVERSYFDQKGNQIDVQKVKSGDIVVVGLKVESEHRAPDALVVDLLPAGFELENPNLVHSVKIEQVKFADRLPKDWMSPQDIKHQEYRDDRYVAAIHLNKNSSRMLFYVMRAVTPGVYQVPPPFIEDMYRPARHAIGKYLDTMTVETSDD